MPKWTKEQTDAINRSGTNIIVSAGAGSGKTAVLTERVITKLRKGTHITNLLVLTFTNAAALEMKDRIRKAIQKDDSLKEELDYIDSAYITTFDSFSMSILKKYHYILNISPKLSVIEKSICDNVRSMIIDDIFDELYKENDPSFLKLIDDLTVKDDSEIKKNIIDVNSKLDILINKKMYLDNYINSYYSEENIDKMYEKFNNYLIKKIKKIEEMVYDLSLCSEEKYYNAIYNEVLPLISSKDYDEIKSCINISLPRVPNNSSSELKELKTKISDSIKSLKNIMIYKNSMHIKSTLISTKVYVEAIIKIVNELDKRLNKYKNENDVYEFNDIAKLAINLVSENDDVRNELKNSFEEIMVDEYQDTSDIQEALITLISNNNLYMVGDVKQSIYRFRNANPDIFKTKYDEYSKLNGGIKIDLLNNFRSREEVLEDINNIFNLVMNDNIGGAEYEKSHQMNYGNLLYSEKHPNQNFNLEILNYSRQNKKYRSSEYEAFIIAKDIKEKIKNGYMVFDKDTGDIRKANYGDFCILLDRKSNFELYKKIFEYLSVPLVIYYDEKITNEKDVLIIKNIIDMIIKIYNKEEDKRFKYDFYSVSRSFLSNMTDEDYLNCYVNDSFKNTDIYMKASDIASHLDSLTNKKLIEEILDKFNFYENAIKTGEIEKAIIRMDYLKSLGDNLMNLGYSPIEFSEYLEEMILNDSDITFSLNTKVSGNVRLMNIHKSKGLEFPICYFAGYENKFNRMDLNARMSFDKELGITVPFFDNGVGPTIVKELYKEKYIKEDISERIRLFYVALTRAREKMIIVTELSEEEKDLNDDIKLEYTSFLSIIESIKKYIKTRIYEVKDIELTKAYNISKSRNFDIESSDEIIYVSEINIKNEEKENIQVSKKIGKLIGKKEYETLKYGTKVHRDFEYLDFDSKDEKLQKFVNKFKDINKAKIYKEYEFISEIDGKNYHGVIDLMLEYEKEIDIIDYKLKNIDDESYKKQLNIYKEYIQSISGKEVKTYLYSIINDELRII